MSKISDTTNDTILNAAPYLPHKPPMLFIDEITNVRENGGTVKTTLRNGSLLLDSDGTMIREGYCELAAQGYGALRGYQESINGRTCGKGFLVGIQHFKVFNDSFAGDTLTVEINVVGSYEGFFVVRAEIFNNGKIYAKGKIKLFTD